MIGFDGMYRKKTIAKKEVKKVNKIPYFELKVVKVKKEKKKGNCADCGCSNYDTFCKNYCSYYKKHIKQRKGNWLNGENLDKIKFPCFCSWNIPLDKDREYGILVKGEGDKYNLYSIRGQHSYSRLVEANKNLKELIERWNIHILKGKLIIFEEEENHE